MGGRSCLGMRPVQCRRDPVLRAAARRDRRPIRSGHFPFQHRECGGQKPADWRRVERPLPSRRMAHLSANYTFLDADEQRVAGASPFAKFVGRGAASTCRLGRGRAFPLGREPCMWRPARHDFDQFPAATVTLTIMPLPRSTLPIESCRRWTLSASKTASIPIIRTWSVTTRLTDGLCGSSRVWQLVRCRPRRGDGARRVASLNLCTDELVGRWRCAPGDRVVTHLSQQPAETPLWRRRLHRTNDGLLSVAPLSPDHRHHGRGGRSAGSLSASASAPWICCSQASPT